MSSLSPDETIIWREYQRGKTSSLIAESMTHEKWTAAYVSRVLNRCREKVEKLLRAHAKSHRLDIESLQPDKGILLGFDYAANTQVYIVFTIQDQIVVWYKHDSYDGKLCPQCPKASECRATLDTVITEYNLKLRPNEQSLFMTQQSIAIFSKIASKEIPRYKRL